MKKPSPPPPGPILSPAPFVKPQLKIVVGTNSLTESQYPAYTNHVQFWYNLGKRYPHIKFILSNPARMSIDRMRNMTAEVALETEADGVLFLDDDVIVQNDCLEKLLNCDADIAAGKVVIRGYPFDWMVFKTEKRGKHIGLFPQKELPETGIEPVDAVGFSLCYIKTSVFKTIPKPWFVTGVNNTEDIYFCILARQANPACKIVVDCSVRCGHILWPEIMDPTNRELYRDYYEKLNPQVKLENQRLEETKSGKKPRDRSQEYLKEVKGVIERGKQAKAVKA